MAYSLALGRPSTTAIHQCLRDPRDAAPWEYLFVAFNSDNFPDLFHPTWIASAVLLVVADRPVQRPDAGAPPPRLYLDMWEWLAGPG